MSHLLLLLALVVSEHTGRVTFRDLPVPGATVILTQGDERFVTTTDEQGEYSFSDVPDGAYAIQVEMFGFQRVTLEARATHVALTILPVNAISESWRPTKNMVSDEDTAELQQSAADGLLINGSSNNGAASPFSQPRAFGNRRITQRLYNGNFGLTIGNSALDARSFSLTGQDTPKPAYNHLVGSLSLGGPFRVPRVVDSGLFFFNYQRTTNSNVTTQTGLVPTADERRGAISEQAKALLRYYPLPNFDGGGRYNYQIPVVGATHHDSLQSRWNSSAGLNSRNQYSGTFDFQRTAADNSNLFGFLDKTRGSAINLNLNWTRSLTRRLSASFKFHFERSVTRVTPFFASRQNVSAEAGITGNNQEPVNWGPPTLSFSNGIARLSDVPYSYNRSQAIAWSYAGTWNRGLHSYSLGADFRRVQSNMYSQQNASGSFAFTGAATGSALADFLLGIPATTSIAFGNADKYFRQSLANGYITDDWRLRPGITANLGVRWEYESPISERYGRLVNLDIAKDFSSAVPVVGIAGSLTPDRFGFQPRLSVAWRPLPASSIVIRAGYGIYRNTAVYHAIALQMAQQAPFSKSFSFQNSKIVRCHQ